MKVLLIDDHPLILSALQDRHPGPGRPCLGGGRGQRRGGARRTAADPDFDPCCSTSRSAMRIGFDVLTEFRAQYRRCRWWWCRPRIAAAT